MGLMGPCFSYIARRVIFLVSKVCFLYCVLYRKKSVPLGPLGPLHYFDAITKG